MLRIKNNAWNKRGTEEERPEKIKVQWTKGSTAKKVQPLSKQKWKGIGKVNEQSENTGYKINRTWKKGGRGRAIKWR